MSTTADSSFIFPRSYYFPPFFTIQPTAATRSAQLAKWSSLILSYCRHYRLWRLSVTDAIDTPLFRNTKLKRGLTLNDTREVLDWMTKEVAGERAEWVGKEGEKAVCWVYWRRPEEWAEVLSDWVGRFYSSRAFIRSTSLTKPGRPIQQAKRIRYSLCMNLQKGNPRWGKVGGSRRYYDSRADIEAEFHGMDSDILQKSLVVLVKRGKAQVFGSEDQQGVKFF